MGWFFIILGLVLMGVGGFLTYYGQQLLSDEKTAQVEPIAISSVNQPILTPRQEKLLNLIYTYQRDLAASKLIITREGTIHLDESIKEVKADLIVDLCGSHEAGQPRLGEFVTLMEQMPTEYLRYHSEARMGNPFVVTLTEAGIQYLRGRQ